MKTEITKIPTEILKLDLYRQTKQNQICLFNVVSPGPAKLKAKRGSLSNLQLCLFVLTLYFLSK